MIILITGGTGSGKDYIVTRLLEELPGTIIKRPTTRPKRTNKELSRYNFLTEKDYLNNNKIHFTSVFRGWFYGFYDDIFTKGLEKDFYISSVDSWTAQMVANKIKNVFLVHVSTNDKIAWDRCTKREPNPDLKEIKRRMKSDKEDDKLVDFTDFYDFKNDSEDPFIFDNKIKEMIKEIKKRSNDK